MSVFDPQIAAAYGALDSDAFFDGMPMNAHLLRVFARNSNRLASKGHQMFNAIWPSVQSDGTTVPLQRRYQYAEALGTAWAQVVPAFRVSKKPGLSKMDVRLRANISDTLRIVFQVSTLAAPFAERVDTDNPNILVAVGTDAVATYIMDGIPISTDREEIIGLWARSVSVDTVPSSAAYGAPTSGSVGRATNNQLVLPQTTTAITWGAGTSSPDDFVSIGAVVQFTSTLGELVATRRIQDLSFDVVRDSFGVTTYLGRMTFESPLTDDQVTRARFGTWEVRTIPNYALTCFVGRAAGRTI